MADDSWLLDYIVTFLRSPPWTAPLNQFIDENCVIFDTEDENKFSYTECHNRFCELIEELLGRSLKELGVTEEQFVAVCQQGQNQEVNKLVFGQILAADDFLTFKKMMVKRNMELELEALKALQEEERAAAAAPKAKPAPRGESAVAAGATGPSEEELLAEAMRLSEETARAEALRNAKTEEEFQAAMQASMLAHELRMSEQQREMAELEHAIALSLAIEAERARQAEEEAAEAKLKGAQEEAPAKAAAHVQTQTETEPKPEPKETAPAPAPAAAEPSPAAAAAAASNLIRAPARLAPVGLSAEALEALRRKAEEEFKRNQEQIRREKEAAEAARKAKLTEEELKRRQGFLRKQREAILARKNKEREEALKQFKAGPSATAPSGTAAAPSATPPAAEEKMTAAELEQKKAELQSTLAARFKQEQAEAARRKAEKEAQERREQLQANLARLEALRAERAKAAAAEAEALAAAQRERNARAASLHANLNTVDGNKTDFSF